MAVDSDLDELRPAVHSVRFSLGHRFRFPSLFLALTENWDGKGISGRCRSMKASMFI
jgi:hypothetical protein